MTMSSRYTSAMAHVPTAKYPPWKRKTRAAVGSANAAATSPASGTATNGFTPRSSASTISA